MGWNKPRSTARRLLAAWVGASAALGEAPLAA